MPTGMLHVRPHEIVVATGAAEILHPVCPGNRLTGILTARAAEKLRAAGVNPSAGSSRGLGWTRRGVTPVWCCSSASSEYNGFRLSATVSPRSAPVPRTPAEMVGRASPRPSGGSWPDGGRGSGLRRRRRGHRTTPPSATDRRRRLRLHGARPSPTSLTPGTAASPSSSCSSEPVKRVSGRARAAPACRRSALDRGTDRRRCPRRSPPGRHRARSRSPRPPPTATSTPSVGPRSTTSTSPRAPGWTGSVAGGGRGTTATPSRSIGRSARASRSVTSRRSASWSSPGRTSSSSSSASTRAMSRTSSPGARATRSC